MPSTAARGRYGERVAASFLARHGYKVLTRNYRTERGEIDLICRHGTVLVFVEVRTRGREDFGRPHETINSAKRDALQFAAGRYLGLLDCQDVHSRFDAVEVILKEGVVPECTLIRGFFSAEA